MISFSIQNPLLLAKYQKSAEAFVKNRPLFLTVHLIPVAKIDSKKVSKFQTVFPNCVNGIYLH